MAYRLEIDPEDGPGESVAPRHPRRHLVRAMVTVVVVLCAGGLWMAYRLTTQGGPSGPVPVIHADTRPIKVRPDDPGGMRIPNQDKFILNGERVPDPKVEELLPPPETPLPPPAPPPLPAVEEAPAIAAPAAPEPAAPPPATAAPAAPSPAPVQAPPVPARPPASAPAVPAPAASPAPAPAGKGYRLQVGAVRSPAGAEAEWKRLQREYADLLGPLGHTVTRVDLGRQGVFYRIQAGPIADAAKAERTCKALERRKLDCILIKP